MTQILRLAENVAIALKGKLLEHKGTIDDLSFERMSIASSSFEIVFSGKRARAIISLSLHPLDMPWCVEVQITNLGGLVVDDYATWLRRKRQTDGVLYEVYPNLLNDPEGKGRQLARELAGDVLEYMRSLPS